MPVFLHPRLFIPLLLVLCAFFAPGVLAAEAPRPGAAGDDGHLWVVAPALSVDKPWQLLHHGPGMDEGKRPLLDKVPGGISQPVRLADGAPAISARGGTLYAAVQNADGSVQVEEVDASVPTEEEDGWSYARCGVVHLPAPARLCAMAADGKFLWLAVEASPKLLFGAKDQAEAAPAIAYPPRELALAMGLPLPPPPLPAPPTAKIPFTAEARLLILRTNGQALELVNAMPVSAAAWLASDGRGQLLLASDARTLWRREEGKWKLIEGAGEFSTLAAGGGEMLLANASIRNELRNDAWSANQLTVDWSVVRDGKRIPAGRCALPLAPADGWSLVDWQGKAALAVIPAAQKSGQLAVRLAPVDLLGKTLPQVELRQEVDLAERQQAVYALQMGVFAVALGLMIWNFRRGPVRVLPHLPREWMPASLWRRLCAVLIDLSLAVVPVALAAGVEVPDMLRHWPAFGDLRGLEELRLGFAASGLFILHTALGELFWRRSAGKLLTGLQVLGLNGRPAAAWRIVLRGALKMIELLSPMMFTLVILSPFRQRLGDLTAGTVVVEKRKPEDQA